MPGVEPGSQAWEACMIPLHYMRFGSLDIFVSQSVPNAWFQKKATYIENAAEGESNPCMSPCPVS